MTSLLSDGVVHLRDVLDEASLRQIRSRASEHYSEILRRLLLRQVMQNEPAVARYAECVERDGGRLDVRHDVQNKDDAVVRALALSSDELRRTIQNALGDDAELVAAGNVVAMSIEGWITSIGGEDEDTDVVLADHLGPQAWHADGPHLFDESASTLPAHALTIFFPMVDLTEHNGATEFALGTHRKHHEHVVDGMSTSSATERAIYAHAGDCIVFDYRCWHRGLANASEHDRQVMEAVVQQFGARILTLTLNSRRQVLYAVVARPWWRDSRNYGQAASLYERADAPRHTCGRRSTSPFSPSTLALALHRHPRPHSRPRTPPLPRHMPLAEVWAQSRTHDEQAGPDPTAQSEQRRQDTRWQGTGTDTARRTVRTQETEMQPDGPASAATRSSMRKRKERSE